MNNKSIDSVDASNLVKNPVQISPANTAGVRLGRGLGRLIPVKNQPNVAEKSTAPPSQPIDNSKLSQDSKRIEAKNTVAQLETASNSKGDGITTKSVVEQIELSKIRPNPRQPRTEFNSKELEGLAGSIKESGLLQPIVVRQSESARGEFEIIAGERRWRAFQMLGKSTIPAIVIQTSDANSGVWALIENIHRTDLNPMDRALAVQRLANEFTLSQDQLAERLSFDRSTVSNLLRLAELDAVTAGLVRQGLLTQGHAKALLGVSDLKTRATLAESTVRGEWSVRTLEREVKRISTESKGMVPRGTLPARRQANVKDLETRLSQLLGTRVTIQLGRKPNTGRVSIEFFSLDQFEGMLSKLGLKPDQMRIEN